MAFDAYRGLIDQVTASVTGLPTTLHRVYENPSDALDAAELPALAVFARSIDAEVFSEIATDDGNLELHRLAVIVASVCKTRDQRDTSSLEVKEAILVTAKPGYLRRYTHTDFEERGEGERTLWVVSQRFEIDYTVIATDPGTIV